MAILCAQGVEARYIVRMSPRLARRVAAVALVASAILPLRAQNQTASAGDRIFETTKLHRVHVTISAAEWAALQTSTPRGGSAVGRINGTDYTDPSGRLIHIGGGFGGY